MSCSNCTINIVYRNYCNIDESGTQATHSPWGGIAAPQSGHPPRGMLLLLTQPEKGETCRGHPCECDLRVVKNIQVIDGALNAVYDIFQATEQEFSLIFPAGHDIAFIDEVMERGPRAELDQAFAQIWTRRIPKTQAMGIHGVLFYELEHKKCYYPTRQDEKAVNPNGTPLR